MTERVELTASSDHRRKDVEKVPLITSGELSTKSIIIGSAWYSGSAVMANTALGVGLLNLPLAFDKAGGILISVFVQLIFLVFVVASLLLIIYMSKVTNSASYPCLIQGLCGHRVGTLCAVLVAFLFFGAKVTGLTIIGDQWDKFFYDLYGETYCFNWYMNRYFTISASAIVLILPFCFFKRIDSLRHVSVIGAVALAYVTIMVIVKYFTEPRENITIRTQPENWTDVVFLVPALFFCYQCHVEVVPVFNCLKTQTLTEGFKTVMGAIGLCITVYTSTAIFGYLTFGTSVRDDILMSYNADWALLIGQILIAVKCLTAYPVLIYISRSSVNDLYLRLRGIPPEVALRGEKRRRITIALIIFCSSLLLALVVPGVNTAVQFIGALVAFLMFVFPGLCLVQLSLREEATRNVRKFLRGVGVTFLVIGVFLLGLTLTQNIMALVQSPQGNVEEAQNLGPCG